MYFYSAVELFIAVFCLLYLSLEIREYFACEYTNQNPWWCNWIRWI